MPASRFVLPLLALLGASRATPPAPQSSPAPPVAAAETMAITAPPQDWQAYLGRRVRIAVPLVFSGQRGDTLVASFDGHLYAPTEVARPGAEAVRVAVDNARRRVWIEGAAAQAMAAGWRSGSTSDLGAIVGDFNAYAMEDPVQALLAQGWQDAMRLARVQAPYSYVYDAQAGRLDHALLSPALVKRLAGVAEWHGNADEPENVGYRDAIGGDSAATPWRSSDHDPFLLGFRLHTR